MARNENPPFGRGEYDTADLTNLAGKTWLFEDLDYSTQGAKDQRTNNYVTCMCVKNTSGIALLPKMQVALALTAGNLFKNVDGYARLNTDSPVVGVDEWLPAAGVPNGSYFWVVIDGPCLTITTKVAADLDNISIGERVIAATAAASTYSTTAGRVQPVDYATAATGAALAAQIKNSIGYAMSAKTSANTDSSLLVYFTKW